MNAHECPRGLLFEYVAVRPNRPRASGKRRDPAAGDRARGSPRHRGLTIGGRPEAFTKLVGLLDTYPLWCNIVTP